MTAPHSTLRGARSRLRLTIAVVMPWTALWESPEKPWCRGQPPANSLTTAGIQKQNANLRSSQKKKTLDLWARNVQGKLWLGSETECQLKEGKQKGRNIKAAGMNNLQRSKSWYCDGLRGSSLL